MSSALTEALCKDFNPDLFLTDPDLTASCAGSDGDGTIAASRAQAELAASLPEGQLSSRY